MEEQIQTLVKTVKGIKSDPSGVAGSSSELENEFATMAAEKNILDGADMERIDEKYNHLLSAYQMTGSAKVKGTVEFIETLVENKVKFIVFCHHYEVMDQIEDCLVKRKIAYIRIDGQIEATKRYEAVKKF